MYDPELPPLPSPDRIQELLFDAARTRREDMIDALMQAGGGIEGPNAQGHIPLVLASYTVTRKPQRLSLPQGLLVDNSDLECGNTALME